MDKFLNFIAFLVIMATVIGIATMLIALWNTYPMALTSSVVLFGGVWLVVWAIDRINSRS